MNQLFAFNWLPVKDGDPRAAALYRRHYSHYQYADQRRSRHGYRNRFLIVGPGEYMMLLTVDCSALFVWRKFQSADNQHGVTCAIFRNEAPDKYRSSDLIKEAMDLAWQRWPGERLYTYINPREVQSRNPGYCFICAGWRKCGVTKVNKLLIFERLPEVKEA